MWQSVTINSPLIWIRSTLFIALSIMYLQGAEKLHLMKPIEADPPKGEWFFYYRDVVLLYVWYFAPGGVCVFFLVTFRCSQVTWLSLELSVVLFVKKTHDVRLVNGRYGVTSVFFLVNDLNHVLTNRSRNIKSLYSPASPGGCQRRVQAWSFAVWHGELFFGGNWNWMTRSFLPM